MEVRYGGSWGTICKHKWDITASNLVCKQLGYKRAESVANFGPGSGHIFLDNVQCKGNEPGLSFCRHRGWFAHNCTHNDDVGIVCTNGKKRGIHLAPRLGDIKEERFYPK